MWGGDTSTLTHIVPCLNQVKHSRLFEHLSSICDSNTENPFVDLLAF